MLDEQDTPTSPTGPTSDSGTATEVPVKAVRRRRATKATAAPAEAPAVPTEPAAAAATAPAAVVDAPAEVVAADEAAPAPAKRTRKAAAKKAAPRKRTAKAASGEAVGDEVVSDEPLVTGEPAPTAPATSGLDIAAEVLAAEEPLDEEAAAAEAAAAEVAAAEAAAAAPAPTTRTRRRAPIAVTFQAPVAAPVVEHDEDEDDEPVAAPAPRRRRRAGTAGAVSPEALLEQGAAEDATPEDAPAQGVDSAEEDGEDDDRPRRRRRGRRGRGRPIGEDGEPRDDEDAAEGERPARPARAARPAAEAAAPEDEAVEDAEESEDEEGTGTGGTRRRRRRRRTGAGEAVETADEGIPTVTHVREPRQQRVRGASAADEDGVRGITGSTRMAAKRARRQEGRDSGRRRPPVLSEAEFLARREAVERTMVVRQSGDRTQIAVLEDGILVEHYVTKASAQSYAGNVYLGRVQNVLPSMEAAFVDIGKGKNGVLYAGEVNYELAGSGPRKIESVLKSGQEVLVQVSKDPIGHKGARLTAAVSLPGRYLVYVPEGSMTGISRKLPENERARLKSILKKVVPDDAGVIIRTAAEGASEEEIYADVHRLQHQWEDIQAKAKKGGAPKLLHAEPDLVVRVVRDVFNEDFTGLVVQGDSEWEIIREYVDSVAPDLAPRLSRHTSENDVFSEHRIDEQLAKALDRKVWLPSGGSLVIDRTEAMVVIDVNTGKYVGKGGNLEETVTRNNLEAAEEIARQLRLRDLGGIIVVDFIDMVLESNRDLVVRRLVECLGRDRTKHQVAEVTSLGLVQMTRKRVGQGLLESFSETCEHCNGRGVIVSSTPIDRKPEKPEDDAEPRGRRRRGGSGSNGGGAGVAPVAPAAVKVDPAVAAHAVAVIAKASALLPREAADDADDAADLPVISGTALDRGDNGDSEDDELDLGDLTDDPDVIDDVSDNDDVAVDDVAAADVADTEAPVSRRDRSTRGGAASTDGTDESDARERAAAYVGPDTGDAAPVRAAEDPDAPSRGRGRRRRSSRGTVTAEPVGSLAGLASADPADVSEQQAVVPVEEVAVVAEPQPAPVVAELAAEADVADVIEQTLAANPADADEAAVEVAEASDVSEAPDVPVAELPAPDKSVPEAAPRRRRRAVSRPAGPVA